MLLQRIVEVRSWDVKARLQPLNSDVMQLSPCTRGSQSNCVIQSPDCSFAGICVSGICFSPQAIIAFNTGRRLLPRSVS